MGWLGDRLAGLDRRNQAVSDFLRDDPDAGTKISPYAEARRTRRATAVSVVAVAVATATLGLLAGVAISAVLVAVLWRRERHPWLRGYPKRSSDIGRSDESDRRP